MIPALHRIEEVGIANKLSRRTPFRVEGFFIHRSGKSGIENLEKIPRDRFKAAFEGQVGGASVGSHPE
jgi:hypothetical protein